MATDIGTITGTAALENKLSPGLQQIEKDVDKTANTFNRSGGVFNTALSYLRENVPGVVQGFKDLGSGVGPLGTVFEKISGAGGKVGEVLGSIGPAGAAAAVGVAAVVGSVTSLFAVFGTAAALTVNLTRSSADLGDELFALSASTSIQVESLSAWKYISAQTDVSIQTITNSVFRMGVQLSEGSKRTQHALKNVGLSLSDLQKGTPEEAFKRIITTLGEIPDAGRRSSAGMAIFGRQFKELAKLTQEDINALMGEAQELGAVFSTEFAVAGDRFNDAMGTVGFAIDGVTKRIGTVFLPVATAFVETFMTNFVDALGAANLSGQGFATVIGEVAVTVGQSLAAIVSVGAKVAEWLVQFFAGSFIQSLGIVDLIGQTVGAFGKLLNAASYLQPALAPGAEFALTAAKNMREFAQSGVKSVAAVSGEMLKLTNAVDKAAFATGLQLPGAVEKVKKEVAKSAEEMRKARAAALGLGEGTGEASKAQEEAVKAANALNKALDDQIKKKKELGIATQDVVATSLGPLIEKLEVAADVSQGRLKQVLLEQQKQWMELAKFVKDAGGEVKIVTDLWDAYAEKAGIATSQMVNFEHSLPLVPMENLITWQKDYNAAADTTTVLVGLQTKAFEDFGLKTPQQLQKVAEEAKRNYQIVSTTAGVTKEQVKIAWQQMTDAQLAAQGRIPNDWKEKILPGVVNTVSRIKDAVNGSFAQMLLGAKGFKEGFTDIWQSIKAGVMDIFTQILQDFTNRFLKGLINALLGQKGGFLDAFKGLFGGGLSIPGLPGWLGGGSNAAGGVAGVTGNWGVAGLPGAGGAASGAAGATPWWSTGLGGGAIGGGAGAAAGWLVGGQTGSTWGSAGAGAGTGALTGLALGGPIGAGIGAAIGGLVGWWKAKQEQKLTNDLRDMFLKENWGPEGTGVGSGFHNLAAKLTEATGEMGGGRLFADFAKANDDEALAKAIDAINKKLAEYNLTAEGTESRNRKIADSMVLIREAMPADELASLHEGYKEALSEGYKGSLDEFQRQQLEFYNTLEEGDERLKTWFSGNSVEMFNSIAAGAGDAAAQIRIKFQDELQKIKDDIATLDEEEARLNASEAPEAHIGHNERKQRESIARRRAAAEQELEKIRNAQQQLIQETESSMNDSVVRITDGWKIGFDQTRLEAGMTRDEFNAKFGDLIYKIKFEYDMPDGPPPAQQPDLPGAAGGIYATGQSGVATWFGEGGEPELGGPRDFMSGVLADAMRTVGSPMGSPIIIVKPREGESILNAIIRTAPQVEKNIRGSKTKLNEALSS